MGSPGACVSLRRRGAQRAQHLAQQRVGGADADHGGDGDREEDDQRADQDARQQPAAEPDVEQRRQGQDRAPPAPRRCTATAPARSPRSCPARRPTTMAVAAPSAKPSTISLTGWPRCAPTGCPEPMARTRPLRHHLRRRAGCSPACRSPRSAASRPPGSASSDEDGRGEASHAVGRPRSELGRMDRCQRRPAPPPPAACRGGVAGEADRSGSRQVDRDDPRHRARARRHDHDPIRQPHRLGDRVRDQDHGPRPLQPERAAARVSNASRVRASSARERLVQQQHRRVGDQRPRQAGALRHPAGQLARAAGSAASARPTRSSASRARASRSSGAGRPAAPAAARRCRASTARAAGAAAGRRARPGRRRRAAGRSAPSPIVTSPASGAQQAGDQPQQRATCRSRSGR